MRVLTWVSACFALAGCASSASFPADPAFGTIPGSPATITLFADQKGALYPNDWRNTYPEAEDRESLWMSVRGDTERMAELERDQAELRGELAHFVADKSRIFILLHGFNDPQPGADASFTLVREAIAFQPGDGVVHFHWDGLSASRASVAEIWFESSGNSQLAGINALRNLLNDIHSKPVVMISHSRGASVILSAVSNPAFGTTRTEQETRDGNSALYPPRLAPNGNSLHAIFLGPAIGCPDFWKPRFEWGPPGSNVLREFPDQLKSIQYTVNRDDWVLRKGLNWARGLTGSFNATNFGWDPEIGAGLQRVYPGMQGYEISWSGFQAGVDHDFNKYARHPVLRTMLGNAGVEVTGTDDTRPVRPIIDNSENLPSSRICQTTVR